MSLFTPSAGPHVTAQPLPGQLGVSSGSLGPSFPSGLQRSKWQLLHPRVTASPARDPLTDPLPGPGFHQTFLLSPAQLQEKGVYKAMSEFDIFIDYIDAYMTVRMDKKF